MQTPTLPAPSPTNRTQPSPSLKQTSKKTWEHLQSTAKSVKHFLASLDIQAIGTGFMWYDEEHFVLRPRSNYFNYHTFQSAANLFNKQATFTKNQSALTELIGKIELIQRTIENASNIQEHSEAAHSLLIDFVRIQLVIDGVTSHGLIRLSENYAKMKKSEKAATIKMLGETAFQSVTTIIALLTQKLQPYVDDLKLSIDLEKYGLAARELLGNRELYCETLRQVHADAKDGLQLPSALIQQCLTDCSRIVKPQREALKNAMRLVQIPKLADQIPTQSKTMFWAPLRIVKESDKIEVQKGVWGTSERTEFGVDNICNLYYCIEPLSKHIMISCGAINTQQKAEQLSVAMNETLKLVPEANERWALHQLNSQSKEGRLIRDAHAHVYLNEGTFRPLLKREVSFLHFNTCLNAATLFSSEDRESQHVNFPSLMTLLHYIMIDVGKLLQNKPGLSHLLENIQGSLKMEATKFIDLAKQIKSLEMDLKALQTSDSEKLDRIASIDILLESLVERSNPTPVPVELPLTKSKDLELKDQKSAEELKRERQEIESSLPKQISELNQQLQTKVTELQNKLPQMPSVISNALKQIEDGQDKSPESESAQLILQVYEKILLSQLKFPKCTLSRNTEIELFILLYRLLGIKLVIICWSGLDRSAFARALANAQIQIEHEYRSVIVKRTSSAPISEMAASTKARKELFTLLLNLEANRNELHLMSNVLINELKGSIKFISELKEFDTDIKEVQAKLVPSTNVRDALLKKIEQKYGKEQTKFSELWYTLRYLELVAAELLGTESEKTVYSTGVVGLKYLYGAYWPKRIFANPHPPERWPMFAFVDNKVIKLVDFSEGWVSSSSSITVTSAAIDIFTRLSLLRNT